MSAPVWLDVSLFVFGLLALSPQLGTWIRRRRSVCPPPRGRGKRTARALLLYLGIASLAAGGLDIALSEGSKAPRPRSEDRIGEAMMAPDFRLPALDEDRSVRFSDYRGDKPVVLVFGSFGCDFFCSQVVHLRDLHEKYDDRADFLFVYVREAGAVVPAALRDIAASADAPEGSRLRLAPRIRAGMKLFDLRFPCLIDNEQDKVATLYNAFPLRLILVDSDGRIAVDSGRRPAPSFPWKRITDWLDRQSASLPSSSAQKAS